VLIGGASGTGKSSLAGELSHRFQFDHRLGTGFIRVIIQSQTNAQIEPQLFSHTFAAEDPVANLEWQATRLEGAILACIARARGEGTSLIIEGTHLVPQLYAAAEVDLFFVLAAPSESEHYARLTGSSHTGRRISRRDWLNVRRLNDYYLSEATRYGVASVVYGESMHQIADLIGPIAGETSPVPARSSLESPLASGAESVESIESTRGSSD
jgi:2-phosphoglycerate kinase